MNKEYREIMEEIVFFQNEIYNNLCLVLKMPQHRVDLPYQEGIPLSGRLRAAIRVNNKY